MRKLHFILLSAILIFIGLGIFFYKYYAFHLPLTPDKMSNVWNIEIRISFNAKNKSSKAYLFIPVESYNFSITSEYFHSGKYGLITERIDGNRQAKWSNRKAKGRQNLYYRAVIQQFGNTQQIKRSKLKQTDKPELTLQEPYLSAAQILWNEIYEHSADLDSIIGNVFKKLNQTDDENVSLLLGEHKNTITKKIETAIQLLAIAGIPSRAVHGFDLKDETLKVKMVHWLEVYYQKKWNPYNPDTGVTTIPESYMAWWRGSKPLYRIKGGTDSQIYISAQKNVEETILSTIKQSKNFSSLLLKFSLLNLPIQNQSIYRIMFLIPLGALIVIVFRNIVGVQTFGTFMPVLIALAFRETQLLWGVVFFSLVVGFGLGIRFYLENLKLLVVPRLSAVLISVIIFIAVLNIITYNLGLSLGLSISLFPIVIISMTIERMSILWEERGAGEALKHGVGTLIVSTIAYFLLSNQTIEHIMFFFPELLLLILGVTILLGRYSGFRLLELYRFRELVKKKL